MDFPEPDEASQRSERAAPSRAQRFQPAGGPPTRTPSRELLRRRLIALAGGAVVVLLMVLLVRGCLNARKERNYENYLRDLSAVVTNSAQLSASFFGLLHDPADASPQQFEQQIGANRGTGEDLLRRVEGLDAPSELALAQADLELAFELRRDGLTDIAEQIPIALSDRERKEAIEAIAADMRAFLASDVLFARAEQEIERVVTEEQISLDNPGDAVPDSQFLPDPPAQLVDPVQLAGVLAAVALNTGAAGGGTHGTEISSTVARPGNVPLDPAATTTISGRGAIRLQVTVLNGGTEDETDVIVSYQLSGSVDPIAGENTIPRIRPGENRTVVLPLEGEIPRGEELSLAVSVLPVPGELIVDNNTSVYPVVFE